jgi:hypothetical protein
MTPFIAGFLMHSGGGPLTGSEVKWFLLVVGAGLLVSICWDTVNGLIRRIHGRNWPTVSAVIEIVSVAFIDDDSLIPPSRPAFDNSHYKATLTYTYSNPRAADGRLQPGFWKKARCRGLGEFPTRAKPSRSTPTHATQRIPCCEKKTFRRVDTLSASSLSCSVVPPFPWPLGPLVPIAFRPYTRLPVSSAPPSLPAGRSWLTLPVCL